MTLISLDTLLKLAEQGHFHREHNHDRARQKAEAERDTARALADEWRRRATRGDAR